jgi:TIR domain
MTFFISYSHADGEHYPRQLKGRLEEAGFKVFLDQADYTAGMDLRRETNRQVRKSRTIVIVGRPSALASEWVRREVEVAVTHQKTPLIININGAVQAARANSPLAAMAIESHWLRLEETLADVESPPSDRAVAELIRSFRATRQETKRQRIVASAASIFALAAAIAHLAGRGG